jgi:hypothetical protein
MNKLKKWIAALIASVMVLCCCTGCDMLAGEGGADVVGGLVDAIVGGGDGGGLGGGTGDIVSSLFDAFLGGNSADYGWGESAYSGGFDNLIGGQTSSASTFSYADVDSIPAGNASGKVTIMAYIIGSNLESENGCATMDIQEMCKAEIGENINLIIEAGGAKRWQNNIMTSGGVGRYRVVGSGMQALEDRGRKSMVEPSEVSDFINYCKTNYPADRYMFIFWDHGGGTLAGFGSDELATGELSLDEISSVFKNSGIKFDFVGFDACLMGTVETAYALNGSADYLIAAEEEEPGYGWHYTGWLKALNKNPQLETEKLGSIIVDDFVASNGRQNVTLSVIDLKKISDVYSKLCELCANGNKEIASGNYSNIAKARKNTKAYGGGQFEQIDIIDFCNKSGLAGADAVVSAVKDAVVYHKTNIGSTNGLAMYFPYDYPSYYKSVKAIMKNIGMDNGKESGFFGNFLSARSGGSSHGASSSPFGSFFRSMDFSGEEWYSADAAATVNPAGFDLTEEGLLALTDVNGGKVLELTDEQWDEIAYADIGVYLDDGEGYIDLGRDNAYGKDANDNIIVDFDGKWVSINGEIAPFTTLAEGTTDDGWYTYGTTKAEFVSAMTGEKKDIDIYIRWDDLHNGGYVMGYRDAAKGDDPAPEGRGMVAFLKGDKFSILGKYYTYEGEYDTELVIGGDITVDAPLKVTYIDLSDYTFNIYAHIRDIYGNDLYTETLKLVP